MKYYKSAYPDTHIENIIKELKSKKGFGVIVSKKPNRTFFRMVTRGLKCNLVYCDSYKTLSTEMRISSPDSNRILLVHQSDFIKFRCDTNFNLSKFSVVFTDDIEMMDHNTVEFNDALKKLLSTPGSEYSNITIKDRIESKIKKNGLSAVSSDKNHFKLLQRLRCDFVNVIAKQSGNNLEYICLLESEFFNFDCSFCHPYLEYSRFYYIMTEVFGFDFDVISDKQKVKFVKDNLTVNCIFKEYKKSHRNEIIDTWWFSIPKFFLNLIFTKFLSKDSSYPCLLDDDINTEDFRKFLSNKNDLVYADLDNSFAKYESRFVANMRSEDSEDEDKLSLFNEWYSSDGFVYKNDEVYKTLSLVSQSDVLKAKTRGIIFVTSDITKEHVGKILGINPFRRYSHIGDFVKTQTFSWSPLHKALEEKYSKNRRLVMRDDILKRLGF